MKGKTTLEKNVLFLGLIGFLFLPSIAVAQTNITSQGFDASPADTWNYTSTLNTGTITPNTSRFVSTPNSLRLGGSSSSGSGASNNDPYILFSNQSLYNYTNVKLSIAFSCDGSPGNKDDLYLDISYDNGITYTPISLMIGKSDTSDNLGFSHVASTGNTVGSVYSYNIPNANTQIKIRIRFDEDDNKANTSHYYHIDNIKLTGEQYFIDLFGLANPINQNSAATTTNGTDFGSTQIGSDPIIRTFTIKNTGTGTVNLTGTPLVSITGSSNFSVIASPVTPITSLNSTTFQVKFNPTSAGVKTATISIASNDTDENPYNFQIKGSGDQTFFDSDGDGIYDNVDIDDDNDGIRDNIEEAYCESSNGIKVNYKFLNETFGTGPRTTINASYAATTTTYCYEDGMIGVDTAACPDQSSSDLNDGEYTVGPTAQITTWANQFWYKGKDHTGDLNGRMAMFNASYSAGIFYTANITGSIPNIPINYSFWVINLDRTDAPSIGTRKRPNVRVEFRDINDNLLTFIETGSIAPTTAGNLAGDWKQFTANLTLSVSSFKVIFINNETGGTGNDLALDDIKIAQTLCDLDNDGVADIFDLDSDNDGMEDIIEVGLGNLSNAKGKMDVAWVDVNGNGLHDVAEAMVTLLDSDSDGIPNYIDLDSDNDGIFDVDESGAGNILAGLGYDNGDGDVNGDGVGDGTDTETIRDKDTNGDGIIEKFGDGILDLFDYGIGAYGNLNQGTAIAPYLNYILDMDGDGIPNYIDVKSNGTTFDIAGTLYASLDANNDGKIDGTSDIDKDGILDAFDTNTAFYGSPRNLQSKLFVDFDGRNDYAQDLSVINGWSNATIMAWINLNNFYMTEGVIVGQDKLQLKVDAFRNLQAVANGTTITYTPALATSQWIHVAEVYDSSNNLLKLYVNGTMVKSTAISGSLVADASLLTIGKNPSANNKFFKGSIDEIRVFKTALTDSQLQKIVYQEIQNNAGQIRGSIIPKDITGLPWANLKRYYKMDNFKNNIIDDHTTSTIDVGTGAKIYNVKNIKVQQAPMPFITQQNGTVDVALNSAINQIRGQDAIDNSSAIIIVNHNITSITNLTNLGMIINPSKNVVISNDSKLQNDWYLKLDGKIDLQGKSQLVQTFESDLDPLSTGSLERDQQGTKNIYNYNYWSSPVGPINPTTNNNNYSVGNIFKDGTNPVTPVNINWISGYNGNAGSPISLARYWIYKFQNVSNAYANWTQVLETGLLAPSQGFTLKGSGTPGISQNYTFVGKPFNGTISNPIAANNLNLSGNPYASALDANAFINDNVTSTNGTLYFWEHYPTNNSHNLGLYQGGYAIRNLTGGIVPVAPALISGLGSSSRIPGRFIPVGQGFFIGGNATGGNIVFKNSQRLFVKEDDLNSNILFRNSDATVTNTNHNDSYSEDSFLKIRLGYTTSNNLHRQALLGFMNENATNGLDYGYDGILFDEQTNDMAFLLGSTKLVIQGESYFNTNTIYPIFIKSSVEGPVKFMIDGLENFDPEQAVYIYDNDTETYHDIRNEIFEVKIPIGENSTRFSLRFSQESLSADSNTLNKINILYSQNSNILHINNNLMDTTVQNISLYNILGQSILTWNVANENQQSISIPIHNINTGTYVVKIQTSNGIIGKKIVVENNK